MSESQAIGVRLSRKLLKKIEKLSEHEHLDRSTTMRILLEEGYDNYARKKAADSYAAGRTTISGAAAEANLSVWEFEQYLISTGFKSQYSIEDLKKETKAIRK